MNDEETPVSYSYRLQKIQNRFAFLRFAPTDLERYTRGLGTAAIDRRDIVLVGDSREDYWKQKSFLERYFPPPLEPTSDGIVCQGDPISQLLSQPYRPL